VLLVLILAGLALAGCAQPAQQATSTPTVSPSAAPSASLSEKEIAVQKCLELCDNADVEECGGARLSECAPWSEGPCLSDDAQRKREVGMPSDWVCDVAHNPRTPADNDPANQCEEYRSGAARHFVEVDPDCKLIRAV
jgi:hypothetical protein